MLFRVGIFKMYLEMIIRNIKIIIKHNNLKYFFLHL